MKTACKSDHSLLSCNISFSKASPQSAGRQADRPLILTILRYSQGDKRALPRHCHGRHCAIAESRIITKSAVVSPTVPRAVRRNLHAMHQAGHVRLASSVSPARWHRIFSFKKFDRGIKIKEMMVPENLRSRSRNRDRRIACYN